MLGRVQRDDLAQRAAIDAFDDLAHDGHGSHHQPDIKRRRLGEMARERERLFLGAHDRLLGEHRTAGRERRSRCS